MSSIDSRCEERGSTNSTTSESPGLAERRAAKRPRLSSLPQPLWCNAGPRITVADGLTTAHQASSLPTPEPSPVAARTVDDGPSFFGPTHPDPPRSSITDLLPDLALSFIAPFSPLTPLSPLEGLAAVCGHLFDRKDLSLPSVSCLPLPTFSSIPPSHSIPSTLSRPVLRHPIETSVRPGRRTATSSILPPPIHDPLVDQLASNKNLKVVPRPHHCDHPGCDSSFARPSALRIHARSHSGDRPFSCPCCGRGFGAACNLARHVKQLHPEIDVSKTKANDIPSLEVVAISPTPSPPPSATAKRQRSRRKRAKKRKTKYRIVEGGISHEVEQSEMIEGEGSVDEDQVAEALAEVAVAGSGDVETESIPMEVEVEVEVDAEAVALADADLFERFTDTSSSIHSDEKLDRFPPLPSDQPQSLGPLPGALPPLTGLSGFPFAPALPPSSLFNRRLVPPADARMPHYPTPFDRPPSRPRSPAVPPRPYGPNTLRTGPLNPFIPLPPGHLAATEFAPELGDMPTPGPLETPTALPSHLSLASYPFLSPSIAPSQVRDPMSMEIQPHGTDPPIDPNLLPPVHPLSNLPRPHHHVASLPLPLPRHHENHTATPEARLQRGRRPDHDDDDGA